MIQIDDAGSGSLIGGTLIGIMRTETQDFYYDVIPVKYFTSPYFDNKNYEQYCLKIIFDGIKNLDIEKSEKIEICRGYMFDYARCILSDKGYNIFSTKIEEPLQSNIEQSFMDYVIGLGVPMEYLEYTKYPFHFHRLLKWVLADFKNREKFCKTGWKSWKKNKDIQTETYYDYLMTGTYSCLKCGDMIYTPSKIKVIKFNSNREYFIYLHDKCGNN